MKTDLWLLWVDDNKDFVESLRPPLTNWVDSHGFDLQIAHHKGPEGFLEDLAGRPIELVVLDDKLRGSRGGKLIEEMRAKNYFHDVVFYSQGAVPEVGSTHPADGVFFCMRSDARDRIKSLIELRLRRVSDLATVRGWIVADSIELEHMLGAVLALFFEAKPGQFTRRVLNQDGLFDFYKKHQVANSLLKDMLGDLDNQGRESARGKALAACKKTLDQFPNEVIHVRNALAHQLEETTEHGVTRVRMQAKINGKPKEIEVTPEVCAKMRKDIRKHRLNLQELGKWLTS